MYMIFDVGVPRLRGVCRKDRFHFLGCDERVIKPKPISCRELTLRYPCFPCCLYSRGFMIPRASTEIKLRHYPRQGTGCCKVWGQKHVVNAVTVDATGICPRCAFPLMSLCRARHEKIMFCCKASQKGCTRWWRQSMHKDCLPIIVPRGRVGIDHHNQRLMAFAFVHNFNKMLLPCFTFP